MTPEGEAGTPHGHTGKSERSATTRRTRDAAPRGQRIEREDMRG